MITFNLEQHASLQQVMGTTQYVQYIHFRWTPSLGSASKKPQSPMLCVCADRRKGAEHLLPPGPQLHDMQRPHPPPVRPRAPPGLSGTQGEASVRLCGV